MTINVTAVVNAHREGLVANPCLRSLARATARAERSGFSTEIIAVLDKADAITSAVFDDVELRNLTIIHVDHGDLGKSRNEAVEAAGGEWIAFLDADDLWGENWLASALSAARQDPRNIVWHPEINVYFGASRRIFPHIDMESDEFNPLMLYYSNCWTALCMARRCFCLELPFRAINLENGIGYEDWHWNMASIGRGAIHKTVKGTAHAIRSSIGSLAKITSLLGAIPLPDTGFRDFAFDWHKRHQAQAP